METSIKTEIVDGKIMAAIADLRTWDKNPRAIKTEDFERLKKQIKELGIYKPLVITGDGEVLGGNMRLKALLELDIRQVYVSIVYPKSDADKLKYALSDNDRVGYYVEDELAELVTKVLDEDFEIDTELYKVDIGDNFSITDILDKYGPDKDEGTKKTKHKCPSCGFRF